MSFNLTLLQAPLSVTETHSDHTWNVALNSYSAYTDIRLVVDIYKNPYKNDLGPNNTTGSTQEFGKIGRLLIPSNEFGNCIFNVETIIRNIVKPNPRNMSMIYNSGTGFAESDPYAVSVTNSSLVNIDEETSQATINNLPINFISFSNGFNGGYNGFENIYHVNEYRLIFGVQYTSGSTTIQVVDETNYGVYSGFTGPTMSPLSAATQPYGVMVWPGVQDNKRYAVSNNQALTYYYSGINLNGEYNYWNTKVYDFAMNSGVLPFNIAGRFMGTFGEETRPMTILNGSAIQTRYRSHYYKCPIVLGFMYGENELFNNSSVVNSVSILQKTDTNSQLNYDVIYSQPISFTQNPTGYNSFLGQRIAYVNWKQNPLFRTNSDVAIFLSSGSCDTNYANGVSEIVQYKMVEPECFNDPVNFLFINRNGVWDTFTFTKKSQYAKTPNKKIYGSQKTLNSTIWNMQSYDSSETTYYGDATEFMTVASNFVRQNDVDIIEELIMSPTVYVIKDDWTPENNQPLIYPYLIPVQVLNKEVKKYQQKYDRVFQYELELKLTPYRQYNLPY
jgi:hypothetical protein